MDANREDDIEQVSQVHLKAGSESFKAAVNGKGNHENERGKVATSLLLSSKGDLRVSAINFSVS